MYEDLPRALRAKYDELKTISMARDNRHAQIAEGRAGNIQKVLPGVFPDTWPQPIVANVIDNTAKELAQVLAALPSIDCLPQKAGSGAAKERAAKQTKVALGYVDHSRLRRQMQAGADWYWTFAAMPIVTEPDMKAKMPCMRIDNPRGAYWLTDAYGNVTLYAKEWKESVASLAAKFPALYDHIYQTYEDTTRWGRVKRKEVKSSPGDLLTVVRLYTDKHIYMWLPEREDCILTTAPNVLGRVPVEIAEFPKWDDESRGAFDQVLWVWLAHNRMALLNMEAVKEAVQAPIVAGEDVQKIPFGPGAVMRAREPDKIKRLGLDIPQSAVFETQALQMELQQGLNRQASASNFDASIVTGRGVEALNGVFSSAVKAAQDNTGEALRRSIQNCFEMDEILWPTQQKTVSGMASGAPFSETYTPAKDIKGNYVCSVTYGAMAGLDPNRALVYGLQLRGDRAIDRATLQRMQPMELDIEGLNRDINLERLDDAALAGVEGLAANLPMLAQSGQVDVAPGLAALAKIRKAVRDGQPPGEALEDAFTPEEKETAQAMSPEQQMLAQLEAEAAAGGGGGAPPGAPPGAAPAGPEGAMPDGGPGAMPTPDTMQMLLAGLTGGGNANLQANVSRFIPG